MKLFRVIFNTTCPSGLNSQQLGQVQSMTGRSSDYPLYVLAENIAEASEKSEKWMNENQQNLCTYNFVSQITVDSRMIYAG